MLTIDEAEKVLRSGGRLWDPESEMEMFYRSPETSTKISYWTGAGVRLLNPAVLLVSSDRLEVLPREKWTEILGI